MPPSSSRAMVDPTTFTSPSVLAPRRFASRIAASVSAVSPDCEITMLSVFFVTIGFRYRNSDAYSTSTGMRASSSMYSSPMSPECQLVPHAVMIIRSIACSSSRVQVEHFITVAGQYPHLTIVEVDDLSGMLEDRRDVAGNVVLAVSQTDQEWASLAGADDLVGVAARDHGDAVRPFHQVQCIHHCVLEGVAIHRCLDQVCEHLRVRLGLEGVPLLDEHLPQGAVVLDDAVVNEGDRVFTIRVRVRVALVGRAVRRPARVRDAHSSMYRIAVHQRLEY